MQQFLKIQAYSETKLQHQASDYEEEIHCLKQEIQRQYKVIESMKLELEDLVFLVNQQRNNKNSKINSQDDLKKFNQDIRSQQNLRKEEQNKEWRIKKSQSAKKFYLKQKQNVNSQASEKTPHFYFLQAISRLEIIAEEQSQSAYMMQH